MTMHGISKAGRFDRHGKSRGPESRDLTRNAIARAKEGDRDALQFLYIHYADHVYTQIQRIVRDRHEAEDLTQNVFAKLMRAIGQYEERGLPFTAWITRVARNTALDHVRSSRMVPCEEVRSGDPEENASELAFERLWSLRYALEQLPVAQREVLVLRHVAGLSPGEIAQRLGKSEGSVHGLHHRARRALKDGLSDLEATPVTSRLSA
jgi:RNA polymerase sigma-70 factor, ECF subfamily